MAAFFRPWLKKVEDCSSSTTTPLMEEVSYRSAKDISVDLYDASFDSRLVAADEDPALRKRKQHKDDTSSLYHVTTMEEWDQAEQQANQEMREHEEKRAKMEPAAKKKHHHLTTTHQANQKMREHVKKNLVQDNDDVILTLKELDQAEQQANQEMRRAQHEKDIVQGKKEMLTLKKCNWDQAEPDWPTTMNGGMGPSRA